MYLAKWKAQFDTLLLLLFVRVYKVARRVRLLQVFELLLAGLETCPSVPLLMK